MSARELSRGADPHPAARASSGPRGPGGAPTPRGADRLVEALVAEGVDVVFGLPGGASLSLHDAIDGSPIRHVLVRHEAAAGHAAEGWARASGRTGVAIVTSGPGATNLATPIADAHADSLPTVFVTAQVPTTLRGSNAFQECDVIGMTAPIVKHGIAVERADEIADAIHEAFAVAGSGRPGPVVVDVPSDLLKAPARAGRGPGAAPDLPGYRPRSTPNGRQLRRAAEAIALSHRPVLLAGGGVVHAGAEDELRSLARRHDLPVTTTLMALGAFPADDVRWLGMPGMYGTVPANRALHEADLIIAVGARFDDRVTGDLRTFAPGARVVHVDIDPAEIGKNVAAHVPVVGDARAALAGIAAALRAVDPDGAAAAALRPWWQRIAGWRAEAGAATEKARHDPDAISAAATLERLHASTGGRAVVTTDVGQHQMWAAQRLRFAGARRWITSGGLGTMGFGLPAAIGAALALGGGDDVPPVVCVTGDGSLVMHLAELATAVDEGTPVKVLLFDNASLGMVREQQDTHYGGRRAASSLPGLDWELLGRGFGVESWSVSDPAELDAALARLLDAPGPALLRVGIPVGQGLEPTFAAGAAAVARD